MIDESKFEKLEKEELENVAGGCGDSKECDDGPMYARIDFQCPNCGRSYCWYDAHEPVGDCIPCCDKCGTKMYVSHKFD